MLINTSFNVRGEPIVCTPADAWRCFMATDIDVLVVEDFVLTKENQTTGRPAEFVPPRKNLPAPRELKWFGILLVPFLSILASLSFLKWNSPVAGYSIATGGFLLVAVYALLPRSRPVIYRGWMAAVYPIGWLVSHVVMTILYFLVFTPVGLLMRATGHDPPHPSTGSQGRQLLDPARPGE